MTQISEETLPKGTEIRIYLHKDNYHPVDFALEVAGKIILDQQDAVKHEKSKDNYYSDTLPESTDSFRFINHMNDDEVISLYQITIHIPGKDTVHLVPSSFANLPTDYRNLVLTIDRDLSISSNIKIDSDWYYNTQILPYIEFAKAHNIGYIAHEAGAGYAGDNIYKEYLAMQLTSFKKHNISWTALCINDFFLYPQQTTVMKEYKKPDGFMIPTSQK